MSTGAHVQMRARRRELLERIQFCQTKTPGITEGHRLAPKQRQKKG
jgi:hypothetical protein